MMKILISIPEQLDRRFKSLIPRRQRSQFLVLLLEKAIQKKEKELYECAKMVEEDDAINQDMQLWGGTIEDGLEDFDKI